MAKSADDRLKALEEQVSAIRKLLKENGLSTEHHKALK